MVRTGDPATARFQPRSEDQRRPRIGGLPRTVSSETALRAHGLSFSYTPERSVLEGVELEVAFGQVLAVLGPNGCGKTTLLRCLAGLREPRGGSVEVAVDGRLTAVGDLAPAQRAARIAYVPQRQSDSFGYTVFEMVLMGAAGRASLFSSPTRADEQTAWDGLAALGLEALAHRRFAELSGGERRLVVIARALATGAPIMLLDEPTAHLDFRNQLLVLETLAALTERSRMSLVMTTHNPADAFAAASAAFLMRPGDTALFGPVSQVLTETSIREAFSVEARVLPVNGHRSGSHVVAPIRTLKSHQTRR